MNKILINPLFLFGLFLRLLIMVFVAPVNVTNWYLPFMDVTTSILTLNPWASWLEAGGAFDAFPYGYAMWISFMPMIIIAKLANLPLHYAYDLTLLAADVCLLFTLDKLLPARQRLLLLVYWLSPIVILASYALGLNDVIPILLLTISIFFIRRFHLRLAGLFLATAISAKLSMLMALPFFLIYIYNYKALRQGIWAFIQGVSVGMILLGLPFLYSVAGMDMLFSNPEMNKIYSLAISMGGQINLYVVPFVYMLMLYLVWRLKWLNFDLFQATTGMTFLLVLLLTPGSPGWFVWTIPFLCFYQALSGRVAILLVSIFSILYLVETLITRSIQLVNGQIFSLDKVFPFIQNSSLSSLLHTIMVAIGLMLAIRIWREAVSRNDFFRLSRKPFVMAVGGDSGAGKDTYCDAITDLFGDHSVVKLSGDDYHLWDRQKPIWQVMTHLNPMANDLEAYSKDLISLADGSSIKSRQYNHQTGMNTAPVKIKSNNFIIASGLHALYLPILREIYNLKIYLDIDEDLRKHFKVSRDVTQRGYSLQHVLNAIDKREADSVSFIRPQLAYADLIFSLQPIHPNLLKEFTKNQVLRLKLLVRSRHVFNELALNRVLVGVCGLHVDISVNAKNEEVQITIEGEATAADIAMAAEILCPKVIEFIDIKPKWQDGVMGLMQLITLSHISQVLTRRFIQ